MRKEEREHLNKPFNNTKNNWYQEIPTRSRTSSKGKTKKNMTDPVVKVIEQRCTEGRLQEKLETLSGAIESPDALVLAISEENSSRNEGNLLQIMKKERYSILNKIPCKGDLSSIFLFKNSNYRTECVQEQRYIFCDSKRKKFVVFSIPIRLSGHPKDYFGWFSN